MINVIIYYLIILSSVLDDGHLFILCFSHVTSTVINSTEKDLSLRSVALDTLYLFLSSDIHCQHVFISNVNSSRLNKISCFIS
jgi:hypothetical protein